MFGTREASQLGLVQQSRIFIFVTDFSSLFLHLNVSESVCPSFGIHKTIAEGCGTDAYTILFCSFSHEICHTIVHVKTSIKDKGYNPQCNNVMAIGAYVLNSKRVCMVHNTA